MNFDDRLTTECYFTDILRERYPQVFYPAKVNLEANGITVKTLKHTSNIWCRDFMPIQVGDHFVKFRYGRELWAQLRVDERVYEGVIVPVVESSLILDGGSIQRGFGLTIVTDKVFKDNYDLSKVKVVELLERLLESKVIVIPDEPGSHLGHSDGICKMVDGESILLNNYESIFHLDKRFVGYSKRLRKIFEREGFEIELLPYAYEGWNWEMTEGEFRRRYPLADEFDPGFGYYINFLVMRGVILFPCMGLKKDFDVLRVLRNLYPSFNVVGIDCKDLSFEGGLMNCVSWNIRR